MFVNMLINIMMLIMINIMINMMIIILGWSETTPDRGKSGFGTKKWGGQGTLILKSAPFWWISGQNRPPGLPCLRWGSRTRFPHRIAKPLFLHENLEANTRAPAAARRRARAHRFPNPKLPRFVIPRFGPVLDTPGAPSSGWYAQKTVEGSRAFSVAMYNTTRE